jgi:hypothetical protein
LAVIRPGSPVPTPRSCPDQKIAAAVFHPLAVVALPSPAEKESPVADEAVFPEVVPLVPEALVSPGCRSVPGAAEFPRPPVDPVPEVTALVPVPVAYRLAAGMILGPAAWPVPGIRPGVGVFHPGVPVLVPG